MQRRLYYVYLLTNKHKTVLYVGVTNDLQRRMWEHKNQAVPGFTSRYNIDRLMYFEVFREVTDAIGREKQIKGYGRAKKVALIVQGNAGWRDLSLEWLAKPEGDSPPSSE
jgi:putative endonuclease